jgi:hypothetical protein
MKPKSFRKFVEEKDASSPHLDALEDELGIDPRDLEKEPMVASFFGIGPYRIVRLKRDKSGRVTHAVVAAVDDTAIKNRNYRNNDGEMTRVKRAEGHEEFIVPVEELDRLMSQSLQPPPQTPGGIV